MKKQRKTQTFQEKFQGAEFHEAVMWETKCLHRCYENIHAWRREPSLVKVHPETVVNYCVQQCAQDSEKEFIINSHGSVCGLRPLVQAVCLPTESALLEETQIEA